jgi:shikimate 5-dehydrogenase
MLVEQAVEQIRIWSGKTPPSEVLARAFDRAGPASAAKPHAQ